MSDIDKLIAGRNAVDYYKKVSEIKGIKTLADKERMEASILAIGMPVDVFFDFNLKMNLQEADRCFRVRRADNPEIPVVCDGCVGRSVVTCIDAVCADGMNYINPFIIHTPNSLMINEQLEEANRLNVTPPYIVPPISFFLQINTEGTIPGYCICKFSKISEPEFDIFWGMKKFGEFGVAIYKSFLIKNGVQPT